MFHQPRRCNHAYQIDRHRACFGFCCFLGIRPGASVGGTTQIQGNTEIKAEQKNTTAVAVGEGNTAKNTAGAIKKGTQIQGNTKITASQKNTTAVAVGKNNTAANEAGVIGGN